VLFILFLIVIFLLFISLLSSVPSVNRGYPFAKNSAEASKSTLAVLTSKGDIKQRGWGHDPPLVRRPF
jgi:hypothetical protein